MMNKDAVSYKLIHILRIIKDVGITDEEFFQYPSLTILGFDSIDLMEVAVKCEDAFDITLKDEDLSFEVLDNIQRLRDMLMDYISSKYVNGASS